MQIFTIRISIDSMFLDYYAKSKGKKEFSNSGVPNLEP